MAAYYRVTLFMNQSVMGWSETWWTTGAVSVQQMASQLNVLLERRAAILFTNQEFVGVRIAEIGASLTTLNVRRKSIVYPPGEWRYIDSNEVITVPVRGNRSASGVQDRPDQVRSALHLRLFYGEGYSTVRYLVGCPDGISVTEPGTVNLNAVPGWVKDLGGYFEAIKTSWGIMGRAGSDVNAVIDAEDLTVQQAAPSLLGVKTGAAITTLPGERLKIHLRNFRPYFKQPKSLNGSYYVHSINTTLEPGKWIYYLRGTAGIDPATIKILGNVQKVGHTIYGVEQVQAVRVGIHKRGRPSLAPRGRRLSRASYDP